GIGNDLFLCGTAADGMDTMFGGSGAAGDTDKGIDTVDYSKRTSRVRISTDDNPNDGATATNVSGDKVSIELDNVHSDIENMKGGAGNDDLRGGENQANRIEGNGGNDYLRTSFFDADAENAINAKTDTLIGGGGDDFLDAIFSTATQSLSGG